MLGIPLLGAIPEDQQVIISTNRGEPLVLQKKLSLSGIAFENAARRLIGKQDYFIDLNTPYKVWIGRSIAAGGFTCDCLSCWVIFLAMLAELGVHLRVGSAAFNGWLYNRLLNVRCRCCCCRVSSRSWERCSPAAES
jgi:hypothetical protein